MSIIDTDKRRELSSFHYETSSSFYAEAGMPEPNYEEPKFVSRIISVTSIYTN